MFNWVLNTPIWYYITRKVNVWRVDNGSMVKNFWSTFHDKLEACPFCIMTLLFLCSNIPSTTVRSTGNAMSYYETASILVKRIVSQSTNITYIERTLKKKIGRNFKTFKIFGSFASKSQVFAKNLFHYYFFFFWYKACVNHRELSRSLRQKKHQYIRIHVYKRNNKS